MIATKIEDAVHGSVYRLDPPLGGVDRVYARNGGAYIYPESRLYPAFLNLPGVTLTHEEALRRIGYTLTKPGVAKLVSSRPTWDTRSTVYFYTITPPRDGYDEVSVCVYPEETTIRGSDGVTHCGNQLHRSTAPCSAEEALGKIGYTVEQPKTATWVKYRGVGINVYAVSPPVERDGVKYGHVHACDTLDFPRVTLYRSVTADRVSGGLIAAGGGITAAFAELGYVVAAK